MIPETIYAMLDRAIAEGRDAALVTIIGAQGSTPRETGAKMLVFSDGETAGTVGGGKLELLCVEAAKAAIEKGECKREVFDLTPQGIGMECAGRNEVFIEVFVSKINLLIMGGGHVGQKIAQAATMAGIGYIVADDRAEFANEKNFPTARKICVELPEKVANLADAKTCIVIVTRGHSFDQECLAAALKTSARYIGMIGSKQKVPKTFANLNKLGLHPETDPRVYSPIGLKLGGKTPGEIAISVLAEILKVCHGETGKHNSVAVSGKQD